MDLCLKLEQLGLNNVYDPGVILLCQGRTLQKKKAQRTATVFRKKWKALLEQPDGYYNTNLSLESSDYRIRNILREKFTHVRRNNCDSEL